jgi:two-component system, chemotaxis family, sensor kinase CheA
MAEMDYALIFREETLELLEELEHSLLALEKAPHDLGLVDRIFRAMHTIKGSGAMFGFDEIADFTHHVETVLDEVRGGKMPVTKNLIDLVLAARDYIKSLLEAVTGGTPSDGRRGEEIASAFRNLLGSTGGEAGLQPEPSLFSMGSRTHFRIRFEPGSSFRESGGGGEEIFQQLEQLGECSVFHTGSKPAWDILLTTDVGMRAVKDVLQGVEDIRNLEISTLARGVEADSLEHQRFGEILVGRSHVGPEDVQRVLGSQRRVGEAPVEANSVSSSQVESVLAAPRERRRRSSAAGLKESIRVPSERLDKLINLVSELVVTQARLTQVSTGYEQSDLIQQVEEIERLTAELRDCVLKIRMLPIGTTFGKLSRLVRDLSAELHKEVDLITEGAETELDKTVIEQLGDPLIHLIRNSIDHGIELPAEREAVGKRRRGSIRLEAVHSGGHVIIKVQDDGRGIDRQIIKARVQAMGLLAPGGELTDQELLNLIFTPGFSTAEKVTSISGRGVGMDVVRSEVVEHLKGTVEVASVPGRGTTMTITLPLTLAIIDGLLVRAGDTHFVLPLNAVVECVEFNDKERRRFGGRRLVAVREEVVPYVRLRDFFKMDGEHPEREQVVVVQIDQHRVGLVLDTVIGDHQTVIKSLGWIYRKAEGLSCSTILGTGEVALIVDVPQLIQYARKEEAQRVNGLVH